MPKKQTLPSTLIEESLFLNKFVTTWNMNLQASWLPGYEHFSPINIWSGRIVGTAAVVIVADADKYLELRKGLTHVGLIEDDEYEQLEATSESMINALADQARYPAEDGFLGAALYLTNMAIKVYRLETNSTH